MKISPASLKIFNKCISQKQISLPFPFLFSSLNDMECHSVTECYHNLGTVVLGGGFLSCVSFASLLHTLERFQLQPRAEPCRVGSPLPLSAGVFPVSKGTRALDSPGCHILAWMATASVIAHPLREAIKSQTKLLAILGQHHA